MARTHTFYGKIYPNTTRKSCKYTVFLIIQDFSQWYYIPYNME